MQAGLTCQHELLDSLVYDLILYQIYQEMMTYNILSTYYVGAGQEQQQALEEENAALAAELSSLNRSARGVEATMRELATLNQMFSTQACPTLKFIIPNVSWGQAVRFSASRSRLGEWPPCLVLSGRPGTWTTSSQMCMCWPVCCPARFSSLPICFDHSNCSSCVAVYNHRCLQASICYSRQRFVIWISKALSIVVQVAHQVEQIDQLYQQVWRALLLQCNLKHVCEG